MEIIIFVAMCPFLFITFTWLLKRMGYGVLITIGPLIEDDDDGDGEWLVSVPEPPEFSRN